MSGDYRDSGGGKTAWDRSVKLLPAHVRWVTVNMFSSLSLRYTTATPHACAQITRNNTYTRGNVILLSPPRVLHLPHYTLHGVTTKEERRVMFWQYCCFQMKVTVNHLIYYETSSLTNDSGNKMNDKPDINQEEQMDVEQIICEDLEIIGYLKEENQRLREKISGESRKHNKLMEEKRQEIKKLEGELKCVESYLLEILDNIEKPIFTRHLRLGEKSCFAITFTWEGKKILKLTEDGNGWKGLIEKIKKILTRTLNTKGELILSEHKAAIKLQTIRDQHEKEIKRLEEKRKADEKNANELLKFLRYKVRDGYETVIKLHSDEVDITEKILLELIKCLKIPNTTFPTSYDRCASEEITGIYAELIVEIGKMQKRIIKKYEGIIRGYAETISNLKDDIKRRDDKIKKNRAYERSVDSLLTNLENRNIRYEPDTQAHEDRGWTGVHAELRAKIGRFQERQIEITRENIERKIQVIIEDLQNGCRYSPSIERQEAKNWWGIHAEVRAEIGKFQERYEKEIKRLKKKNKERFVEFNPDDDTFIIRE